MYNHFSFLLVFLSADSTIDLCYFFCRSPVLFDFFNAFLTFSFDTFCVRLTGAFLFSFPEIKNYLKLERHSFCEGVHVTRCDLKKKKPNPGAVTRGENFAVHNLYQKRVTTPILYLWFDLKI